MRRLIVLSMLALVAAACGADRVDRSDLTPPPTIEGASIRTVIADAGQPVVLNIWASWCIPCRSEAPLLASAHDALGDEVTFIGVAVDDGPLDAAAFLEEFDIVFDNYLDQRSTVPAELGGFGVPLTYFFSSDGELVHRHNGVIDEGTLAIRIDELLRGD